MKAVAINEFGGREKLELMDLPRPHAGSNELLVGVRAAGVNPVDWKIREGWFKDVFDHRFPVILGWDAAGVIVEAGGEVTGFREGDEVFAYCRKREVAEGAYGEYITLSADAVAHKPESMSFEEASSVPLAALTAYQALFDAATLFAGETVFIHAASGGVGTFAVQLAKNHGAYVLGTASSANHDYLRKLGVDRPIDYRTEDPCKVVCEEQNCRVDVVFDCLGNGTLLKSQAFTTAESRNVSIVDTDAVKTLQDEGKKADFVFVKPDGAQLQEIRGMIDTGWLSTHLAAVYSLEEAAKAHEHIEAGHTRGKIVLTPS